MTREIFSSLSPFGSADRRTAGTDLMTCSRFSTMRRWPTIGTCADAAAYSTHDAHVHVHVHVHVQACYSAFGLMGLAGAAFCASQVPDKKVPSA